MNRILLVASAVKGPVLIEGTSAGWTTLATIERYTNVIAGNIPVGRAKHYEVVVNGAGAVRLLEANAPNQLLKDD